MSCLAQQANSRAAFLADLTLDPPTSTGDLAGPPHLDEEYVVLSTIHSAKGCEWDVIYIIHAADGVLPSDMVKEEEELEEERRLLYVAMTRARDVLVCDVSSQILPPQSSHGGFLQYGPAHATSCRRQLTVSPVRAGGFCVAEYLPISLFRTPRAKRAQASTAQD